MKSLAPTVAGTADSLETRSSVVAAGSGLRAAAALGPAEYSADLASCPYLPPGEQADDDYPLITVTRRRLTHYNSET
ncbi:hypothetical protein ACFWJW_03120 [Streptomyces sp. NPDC127097]|uniref:hypothetical protein n=1 Tax=Streptomyces sp. NPDC127097 TaxID=3347136 RepID=UPI003659F022